MLATVPLEFGIVLRTIKEVVCCGLMIGVCSAQCAAEQLSPVPTTTMLGSMHTVPPSANLRSDELTSTHRIYAGQVTHIEIPVTGSHSPIASRSTNEQFLVGEPVGDDRTATVLTKADVAWQTTENGRLVGTVAFRISGSEALRAKYRISCEGRCRSYVDIGNGDSTGVAIESDNEFHWSPLVRGDQITIQVVLQSIESLGTFELTAGPFSRVSLALDNLKRTSDIGLAGACTVDFHCVSDPSNRLTSLSKSVTKLLFTNSVGVTSLCTATLLNSVPYTGTPYLLTAAHCLGPLGDLAPSLTTFWSFDSPACGSNFTIYTQVSGGAQLVMYDPTLDVALLRMNSPAPLSAIFAGISGSPVTTGTEIISLHHPKGDLKKFSRGYASGYQRGPTVVGGVANLSAGLDNYLGVVWTIGATEGGSSGAPALAFRASSQAGLAPGYYEVKGVLSLGSSSCGARVPVELFGRVDLAMARILQFVYPAVVAPNSTASNPIMFEFFNPQYDYYFMTSRASEINALDNLVSPVSGTVAGVAITRNNKLFHRTGQWYRVDAGSTSSRSQDLTRYFIRGAAKNGTRGSHFYTSSDSDRAVIRATGTEVNGTACNSMPNKWFCNEGVDSKVTSPVAGQCLSTEAPVYRLFRGEPRYQDDGNHRYTGDTDVLRYMRDDLGWTYEGLQFCVRP